MLGEHVVAAVPRFPLIVPIHFLLFRKYQIGQSEYLCFYLCLCSPNAREEIMVIALQECDLLWAVALHLFPDN